MNQVCESTTPIEQASKDEKEIRRAYNSAWYAKNKEAVKEYGRRRRLENPEKGKRYLLPEAELAALREKDRIKQQKRRARCDPSIFRDAHARWYAKNKEKVQAYHKKWYAANTEKARNDAKDRRNRNIDAARARDKKRGELLKTDPIKRQERRDYQRLYIAKRLKNDVGFALVKKLRGRILSALSREKTTKHNSTLLLIGCSKEMLRERLEKQFKRGMTWANHGKVWHIDHTVPCASFDLTKEDQQRQCFHHSNLRPIWANENLAKMAKIIPCQPELPISLL